MMTSRYRSSMLSKDLLDLVDAFDQRIDFALRAIEIEAGTRRRRDAELLMQRLRAMVPGAHRDPVAVEDLRHIVRVDSVEGERRHSALLVRRGAEQVQPWYFLQPLERV